CQQELYRFARYLTGSRVAADDLVQNTNLRALEKSYQFQPGTCLKAWLFAIMRNGWKNQRRRAHLIVDIDGSDGIIDNLLYDSGLYANGVADRTILNEVLAQMETLPVKHRQVLVLNAQGYSQAEIATIEGVVVGSVKSRLSRARWRLA